MRGILHSDETLCTASDGCLAIAVWHGEPTPSHVDVLEDMVRSRVSLYSSAILMIIVERAVLPPEAARARMAEVMTRYKDGLTAISVVIEVDGLFGMALRTLGRGITIASGSRTPTLFAGSVFEAVQSLTPMLAGAQLDASRVLASVADIRQRYSSSFPPAGLS